MWRSSDLPGESMHVFFFSSRRRHTRLQGDWSSDVCSSDLLFLSFDGFIGQTQLKNNLAVYIEAAKKRGEALDHCLFAGPPGLGKTTLATLVAKTIGSELFTVSGPALDKKGDLAAVLTNLKPFDVLFIDEIHRVPIAVEEGLYSAMEDFKL